MTAAIAILAFAVALAVLVAAAAWLDRRGTPGPALCLALPVRLVMPHTGHHRDRYATETPAPEQRPGQAPRPGDPPWANAARSGPGQPPRTPAALTPVPQLAAAPEPSPAGDDGAAPLPQPVGSGLGQPSRQPWVTYDARPTWEVLTDGDGATAWESTGRHVTGTAFMPRVRETGGMPALERPAARRHFDHVDRWWTP